MAISSAVSPEDQRSKICWLRCMFVASLLTATAVCSATVFSVIRRLQVDLGEQNFLSVANSALKGAQAISRRKVIALQSLAETHAHTFPNASQWPFVAMPGYSEAARLLANISSSVTIGTQVILRPDQVSDFEDFAAQTYRNRGYSESAGMSEFGFGMFRNDPQNSNTSDGRIHDVYRNDALPTKHNVSVPIFQCSDKNSKILLFNAYSEKFRRNAIDSMLDCASSSSSSQQNLSRSAEPPSSCGRITDFVELVSRPGPAAVIFQPICPKNDPTIIVGFVATTTHWVEMLTDVVPDYVDGLFCVIATPQSAKTFVITNGIPELLGEVCCICPYSSPNRKTYKLTRVVTIFAWIRVICMIEPLTNMRLATL